MLEVEPFPSRNICPAPLVVKLISPTPEAVVNSMPSAFAPVPLLFPRRVRLPPLEFNVDPLPMEIAFKPDVPPAM